MSLSGLGPALRSARKSRGLSVARACQHLGVSPATLKRWESNQGRPSAPDIENYAKYLEAPPESPLALFLTQAPGIEVGPESVGRPIQRLLRGTRRRNGITLETVSSLTGISLASLHRYETGERAPTPEVLRRVAAACGLQPEITTGLLDAMSVHPCEMGESGQEVINRFLIEGGQPHLHLYRYLDQVIGCGQPSSRDIRHLVHGFANMGDHQGLIEVWELMSPLAERASWPQEDRISVASMLMLARVNTTRDRSSAFRAYEKRRRQFADSPPRYEDAGAGLLLCRAAVLLGERAEAEDMLRLPRKVAENEGIASLAFLCDLHQVAIDFQWQVSSSHVKALENLAPRADGPLQQYNLNVAVVAMMASLGDREGLRLALETCRDAEQRHGYGAPLVMRMRRRLATRERLTLSAQA